MKAAEREEFREWIRNLVTRLKSWFYLEGWHIDILWDDDQGDSPDGVGDGTCVAHIISDDSYLQAVVHYTPYAEELWEQGRRDKLLRTTVHELSHILTRPLYDYACHYTSDHDSPFLENINERVTQMVSTVIARGVPDDLCS